MKKGILATFLILVITISPAACSVQERTDEGSDLPPVFEIMIGVIEAQSDISTYQFEMDMDTDVTTVSTDEVFNGAIIMGINGAIDIENSQMSMGMNMSMIAIGEEDFEISMGMYLFDNVMYMMTNIPEIGPMWIKSEMPVLYWEEFDQIDPQLELLVDAIEVKVIGSEQVRDIDCYILEIIPDMEQLWQIAMQQSALTGEEMLPEINKDFLQEMLKDFSVKQWIAKDTYFLSKAKIDMDIEITPEAMGFPGEDGLITLDITMDLFAYDYNQPVKIELPPEAEDAIDMPIFTDY
jgi:hypothetical protein